MKTRQELVSELEALQEVTKQDHYYQYADFGIALLSHQDIEWLYEQGYIEPGFTAKLTGDIAARYRTNVDRAMDLVERWGEREKLKGKMLSMVASDPDEYKKFCDEFHSQGKRESTDTSPITVSTVFLSLRRFMDH